MSESDDQPERQASADLTEDADTARQTPKPRRLTTAREERAARKAMNEIKERVLRARARWNNRRP
jgi:hypothetical protein